MEAWIESLSKIEFTFFLSSAVGGITFLVWLMLMLVGIGDGLELDVDAEMDTPDVGDSDTGFKVLSLQTISSFFLMFGLVGLAITRELHGSEFLAVAGGTCAGVTMVWVLTKMMKLFISMQHSGTMNLKLAEGKIGTVYLGIPSDGVGKVEIAVDNRLMVLDAVTDELDKIVSGTQVVVKQVLDDQKLLVETTNRGN